MINRPRVIRPFIALLLACSGLLPALRAQVSVTFAGVTTQNVFPAGQLDTNVPVGSAWSATVAWNANTPTMFSSGTQAQYRLTNMSFTLNGVSSNWTTDVNQTEFAPSFTLNTGAKDEIQFTSGWGAGTLTNPTLYEWSPMSINIVLGDPTNAAIASLTPAPGSLSLSDWSTSNSHTYLKVYLNNDGNRFIYGNIQSINGTGAGSGSGTGSGTGTGTGGGTTPPAGPVTVTTGTLVVTDAAGLGTGATISASATLDLQNLAVTVPVTLNGGTLAATTGTSSVSANVTLGADSTVAVSGTQLTISGAVSGSFGLTKTGAGTLVVSGTNTYTGTTTVDAGTLQLGGNNVLSGTNTSVTVSAGATFNVNGATDSVGAVSGAGNILLNAGSLTVGGSQASSTFSGVISGTGALTKTGSGTLTLSGQNTFTGATTVSAGTLVLQNSSVGSAQVTAGGTLAGIGIIRGDMGNAGLLIPGFSPGTINVTGGFSQSSTGRLRMELASATSFDRLVVAGTAALGGTLEVVALPGFSFQAGQNFAILTANSVTGTFATVSSPFTSLPLGIRFATLYSPTAVTLAFQQQPFAPYAMTGTQLSVAGALDAALAAGRAPALQGMFNTYTAAADVRAALDQLAPVGYTHWFEAALAQADAINRAIREPHATAEASQGVRAWAEVFRRDADFAPQPNEPATNLSSDGIVAAVDWTGAAEWSAGVLLAYEDAKIDGIGRTRARSFQPVLTARRESGVWRTDFALGHAWHDYDATRPVALPGFPVVAGVGEASGRHWFASLRQGYTFDLDAWTFTPALELQHFSWSASSFTETGAGEASLMVGSQSGRSLAGKAGARLAYSGSVDRARVQPFIEAGWRHEFRRGARLFDSTLAGSSFTTTSLPPSSGGWTFAAGLNAAVTDRLSLAIRYQHETETSVDSASDWQARFSYGF